MSRRKPNLGLKLQFTLRSFLLVAILFGISPWLWSLVHKWRSSHLWRELERARIQRDVAQREWKKAEVKSRFDESFRSDEVNARRKYFSARDELSFASADLDEFYEVQNIRFVTVEVRNGERWLVPDNRRIGARSSFVDDFWKGL